MGSIGGTVLHTAASGGMAYYARTVAALPSPIQHGHQFRSAATGAVHAHGVLSGSDKAWRAVSRKNSAGGLSPASAIRSNASR